MRVSRSWIPVIALLAAAAQAQVISTNTTWSGTVNLDRDVRIDPGVTLTVNPGTIITAATTDAANLGSNASRIELIVQGTLNVNGTGGAPVLFTSAGTTSGAWVGVRVEVGGVLTASSATFEEATAGVQTLGSATLTGCTLRTSTYGVQASGGTTSVTSSFFTGTSYGGYGAGGALTVDRSTLVGNSYAVFSSSSSGSVAVTNSVLTNNSSYGLYRSSGSAGITNSTNDVWQNGTDYFNTSAGAGSFSANPLYVGGGNYRLTSNSPARTVAQGGGDLGAFPYVSDPTPGLHGTLWSNTTVSANAALAGDLTVAPGVTLTIDPGVTLTAATSDLMQSGADSGRVELIVRGALSISGTATLSSSGASSGSWRGVRVEAGGTLTASGLLVERATYGVENLGTTSITGATFRTNSSGVQASGGTATVGTSFFTGNSYGVLGQGGAVSVDHSTLVGNSYAVFSSSAGGSVAVTNSVLTNNSSYGLYRSSGSASISNSFNDVWQNGTDYFNTSAGTGSFSSNPLYVGGGNYRLTSNSPARNSDSTGTDLGAFPYVSDPTVGLLGTLWSNTTLSTGTLTGDLTIPAGVTVTLPAGATLTAATSDAMQSGTDSGRVELIVRGTLTITGTPSMTATLSSSGASSGSWRGVRVEAGGTLTASGLLVERATYGVENLGTTSITGATFRTNSSGVQASGGTATVGTSFFTGNSYGVLGQGGAVSVDHSTLVGNSYAVFSSSAGGSVAVTNSVLTNNSSYGLYRSSGSASISNSFNDVWQNGTDYFNTSAGTGSFSSNPLYVGGGNYRLTSNSPARNSDSTGTDLGAFPYVSDPTPGLHGTLWVNTTVSSNAAVAGDLTVAPGVTLTINPGVTLTAATSDLMQAGSDSGRVELIVRGTLSATGTTGSPVTFSSSGASSGSWRGVRVEAGGAFSGSNLLLERATYGVENLGTTTLSGATFRTNSSGVQASGGTATVGTSFFTGNSYGVLGQGGAVSVDHSTLVSNSYAVFSSSSGGSVAVTNSVLTNNSSYGLYRSSGSASISNSFNDVWQNGTDYFNTSAGTGSFSSNPLYVGGGNYRLTSNSPARNSDSSGGDLGAFPYLSDATAGLLGTLWTNTTLSANATLSGDLTVGPGVTLTVAPGVTLTATASDAMLSGSDSGRVELIVNGTLTVSAPAGNPAIFTATGASAGSWTGIRVGPSGAASLSGVTITRASVGIDAQANVSVSDATFTTNSTAVRASAGTLSVGRSIFTGNSYGAFGQGGLLVVDHSTLVSNSYAVFSSASAGSVTVSNSVITNNSSYGLYRSSGSASITNSFNDVWQNGTDYFNTSPGTGSFSANPLYVGGGNYRLTSNSPARKSDAAAADLGALPYVADPTVGLVGTLWVDTTLSTNATLAGDLTVAPGVTVTVAPGVTLTAPAGDLMIAGADTSKTELIVLGTLQLSGTPSSPVVLSATGASSSAWTGVRVLGGGSVNFTSATVQRASVCLDVTGTATVSGSRFTTCGTGVRANTGGTATLTFSVFDADSYGVMGQGGALSVDHATFYGDSYGVFSSSSTGSVSVQNSILSTQSSYGLYRSSGSASISNSYNLLFNAPTFNTTIGGNSLAVDPQLVAPSTGDFRLQSTSPARGAGTSASDLGAFPFAPGAVDRVVVSPVSATVAAGATITFTATAYDAANNPVPSAVITWSALGAAGMISPGGVLTAACTPGSVTGGVTATSNGKSASANVTITPGAAASLMVTPGNPTVRSQQTQAFSAVALDACNNVVPAAVNWSTVGSVGTIDSAGVYTAGCTRGAFPMSIVATSGSVTGLASVTVDPGLLSNVTLSPNNVTLAINGTRQFTGSTADGCGNPLTVPVTYATTVTGANISSGGLFTAGTSPGTWATGVTASATEGATTRSASASVTVTGGAVASVQVMPGTATLPTGGSTNFMAVALDSAGNMVAGTPTWSVVAGGGTINASGSFSAGTVAGTFSNTVRATISGVSGTASVVVQPGPVTRVVVSPMSVTLAPGGSTTFTAQGFDANDNPVVAPVTWAASGSAGTITAGGVFTAGGMSGNYPAAVTATINGVSASASVSINPGALAQLTVTPAVASVQAGGTVAFAATGRDGNGNTVPVTPTWTVVAGGGSVSSAGVFTAGTTTGTFANTVRAESNGVTAFATVTVSAGPLVVLELTPSSVELMAGGTQQFSAAGQDAFGNPVAASVTWSSNPNAGSITAGGLFTAGALGGDFPDGVTATAGVVSATASVRVSVPMMADAGTDAGVEEPDAGAMDAGLEAPDAGTGMMPDAGMGNVSGNTGCTCSQVDPLFPLVALVGLAFRRRRRAAR